MEFSTRKWNAAARNRPDFVSRDRRTATVLCLRPNEPRAIVLDDGAGPGPIAFMSFISNAELDLAFQYVRHTNRNIFLTGRAGTGKTSFLRKIVEESPKRMVVTAPTGVAAINAGGMTLHSFFQLPFGLHVPGRSRESTQPRRFSRKKVQLLRTLDLLVIDEISMVRADLLDAVDDVLRRYRSSMRPFGGVQLLMIGDLHQLPPVVKTGDWSILCEYYETPYFFSSRALEKTPMVTIELQQIFRQSDTAFIELLNRVRDNQLTSNALESLNSRYRPGFQPSGEDDYITLTSHNASAADLNVARLQSLEGGSRKFNARIEGDFPESAYPTDAVLELKKGAQVMFVKNDLSEGRLYYNGKLGTITRLGAGEIFVRCKGESLEIPVEPAEWTNIKYALDDETSQIKEDILGSFTQYPLKLAWAITIHKSQGLTFDRVIIDAQAAFAHGQVYVALSRCRTLEGIVLSSKIHAGSVKTDSAVKAYGERAGRGSGQTELQESKRAYQQAAARELFDFGSMKRHLFRLDQLFVEHPAALSPDGLAQFKDRLAKTHEQVFSIADRFSPQLEAYLSQPEMPEDNASLQERLRKASLYFVPKLDSEVLSGIRGLHLLTDDKALRKAFRQHLEDLAREVRAKHASFAACQEGFSAAGCSSAKTRSEASFRGESDTSIEPRVIPKNIPHPELYARLLQWRADAAEDLDKADHEILSTRLMQDLVRNLPDDRAALRDIRGMGKTKVTRYGARLLEMIARYKIEKNLPRRAGSTPRAAADTKTFTLELYKSGKSIDEIAAQRGLTIGTVEKHLAYFIGSKELRIFDLLPESQVTEIAGFFTEKKTESLTLAKAHFGDRYSYGQLRLVAEHVKSVN